LPCLGLWPWSLSAAGTLAAVVTLAVAGCLLQLCSTLLQAAHGSMAGVLMSGVAGYVERCCWGSCAEARAVVTLQQGK
jgi:hypothetical protein